MVLQLLDVTMTNCGTMSNKNSHSNLPLCHTLLLNKKVERMLHGEECVNTS